MGKIVYLVNLDPVVRTSKLSEEILSADRDNIDSVEWDQKESQDLHLQIRPAALPQESEP